MNPFKELERSFLRMSFELCVKLGRKKEQKAHFYTIVIKDFVARIVKVVVDKEVSMIFYPECGINMKKLDCIEQLGCIVQMLYNEYEELSL